ncbi:MAG: hypothetical protein JSW07_19215 [bacterium]|nr:MAG: hypothetical protein JSW07_19215 [bacterium]
MFLKQPRIRRFEYSPRFFRPESEEEDDDNRRIKFRRLTTRKSMPKRSFWGMLILIVLLIFLIRYLSSFVKSDKKEDFRFEDLKIETIE